MTVLRWIEWFVLFVAVPAVAFLEMVPVSKFAIFALPVVYAVIVDVRMGPHRPPPALAGSWRRPLLLFALAAPVLLGLTAWLLPGRLFEFPRQRPGLWALVMILYPFLSALPQEFLYRRFYFRRYARLFRARLALPASSALTFCFLHVMYDNAVALVLSLAGGVLFTLTYMRTGRLLQPWVEHALYGQLLFTIGLGRYFYEPV